MADDRLFSIIPRLLALAGVLPLLLLVLWLGWKVTTRSREVQDSWTRVEIRVIDTSHTGTITVEFPWQGQTVRRDVARKYGFRKLLPRQTVPVYVNPADLDQMSPANGLWTGTIALGLVALVLAWAGLFLMAVGSPAASGPSPQLAEVERADLAELERAAANPRAFDREPAQQAAGRRPYGASSLTGNKRLQRLLEYRPGTAPAVVGVLALFFGAVLFNQYRATGQLRLGAMVDRGASDKPFWERNPHLELVDWYPQTSLVMARDRPSGHTGMLDLSVVSSAKVLPRGCAGVAGFDPATIYPQAGEITCYAIDKPDTGAGTPFAFALSFTAKAKDSEVARFYRDLFRKRGQGLSVIQDSSRSVVLEATDAHDDTVARISIRSSFDTAYGFFAWTAGFE